MRNISGPAVWGDDFRFRERELKYAETALVDGNSLLVLGLRRIGKSSFLLELRRRFEASGTAVLCFIDVQDKNTAMAFWDELLRHLPDDVINRFERAIATSKTIPSRIADGMRRVLRRVGGYGVEAELNQSVIDYWRPLSDALEAELAKAQPRVVILIDELPFFIENLIENNYPTSAVNELLATLRSWRNRQIPLVLAGSISIDALLESLGLSGMLMNNVGRVNLRPLTREQARQLLQELVESARLTNWTEATYEQVLERLDDTFPYFVQCAFQHLRVEDRGDTAYIDDVFRDEIDPELKRAFFSQFDERLEKRFPSDLRTSAARILDHMASNADGQISIAAMLELCVNPDDVSLLIRRLEMAEFIVESSTPQHFAFPFQFLCRWRQSRGAGR